MMSGTPSPFTSPAATYVPPDEGVGYATKLRITAPVLPSNTRTIGNAPSPGAVMMSATPSLVRSAIATRMPPANDGSSARRLAVSIPRLSNTRTEGEPPPAAVTNVGERITRSAYVVVVEHELAGDVAVAVMSNRPREVATPLTVEPERMRPGGGVPVSVTVAPPMPVAMNGSENGWPSQTVGAADGLIDRLEHPTVSRAAPVLAPKFVVAP